MSAALAHDAPQCASDFDRTEDYFEALEGAVLQTPRGRWFLSEYAKRLRNAESRELLGAMERLTQSVTEGRNSASLEILRRELQEMSASIMQTRREIAAIKPTESSHNKIVAATEELDQIVRSTEQATADILTASERLQAIGAELLKNGADAGLCSEIDELTTNMMLACSFQDLTGQRTSKVVKALNYIEQRVNSMIEIWGITVADAKGATDFNSDQRRDAHLLNGPAKSGEGVSQDDIDRMMAGGDPATDETRQQNTAETVDDDGCRPSVVAQIWSGSRPATQPAPQPAPSAAASSSQDDIDALFAN